MTPFRHEAFLYRDAAAFLARTVPFLRDGIAAGEPVMVVESREKIEQLRAALGRDADVIEFADMSLVGANPARIIPAWREFVDKHAGSDRLMRGIGEPIWAGRTELELVESQHHESLLNITFAPGTPLWLLCPYDTSALPAAVIDEARRSHEFLMRDGPGYSSTEFRGVGGSAKPFDAALPEAPVQTQELNFDGGSLAEVRRLTNRIASGSGLGAAKRADLVSAANEVATNTICHGGGGGWARVWRDRANVTVEIRDTGHYVRPLADRERPPRRVSGSRGLWLANQLCDLVQIRSFAAGTVVRLHMRRTAA
jgi:anti-sigma regulatory factor (Ser/Thr protein kinase)